MKEIEAPVKVGDVLAGKYRVEKILGVGAMGVVVAATHVDLQELRAIKFMLPSSLGDGDGVERFLREARASVRLKSQHVAKVHDVGRLENGSPYIVMEHLHGVDLKGVLEMRGTLPVAEAVRYVLQACEALAEAHALGIIHRDVKPANLFVTTLPNGAPCVKVLDFGIAKVTGGSGPAMDMTRTTELLGTPLYMSPEQMRSTRNVDARTDIWALGCILYRALTGKTPFAGSTVTEICAAVIADQPDPPAMLRADVPPALEAVVMRCLEKAPAKRFASAAELSAALAPFAEERAAAPPPELPLMRTVAMVPSASFAVPTAPRPAVTMGAAPPTPPVAPLIQPAPPPIAPAPIAPAPIAPAPPPLAAPSALAPGRGSRAALIVSAAVVALLAAGGALFVLRGTGAPAQASAAPLTAPSALAPLTAPSTPAPSAASSAPVPVATTEPPAASASAAPAASAPPPESARPAASAAPLDAPAPTAPVKAATKRPAQAKTPPAKPGARDAFGNDRK